MKFLHLSDLHLGKRFNNFSLAEDQTYILGCIYKIIDDEKPQGVIIAGDVYDRSIPSTEAVELFDSFLVELAKRKINTYIISGNHDSAERLAFGNRLLEVSNIYLSPVFKGDIKPVTVQDEFGNVNIYMLPFVKPSNVRAAYPDEEISSYTDAVRLAVNKMNINKNERNILVAHQFVTGASTCESETVSVGGSDNVDSSVFADFDYVALGHIHGPQNIGSEKIRYCGTPLKYSFSEENHIKSVTVVEISEKGKLDIKTIPLTSLRNIVTLKGKYDELMSKSFYDGTTYKTDFVRVILTDEEEIYNAMSNLRVVYTNIAELKYDNTCTRNARETFGEVDIERKSPLELFAELFEFRNSTQMSDEQSKLVSKLIEKIWEDKR